MSSEAAVSVTQSTLASEAKRTYSVENAAVVADRPMRNEVDVLLLAAAAKFFSRAMRSEAAVLEFARCYAPPHVHPGLRRPRPRACAPSAQHAQARDDWPSYYTALIRACF